MALHRATNNFSVAPNCLQICLLKPIKPIKTIYCKTYYIYIYIKPMKIYQNLLTKVVAMVAHTQDQLFFRTTYFEAFERIEEDIQAAANDSIREAELGRTRQNSTELDRTRQNSTELDRTRVSTSGNIWKFQRAPRFRTSVWLQCSYMGSEWFWMFASVHSPELEVRI